MSLGLPVLAAALLASPPANDVSFGLDVVGLSLSYAHRITGRWSAGAGVEAGIMPRVLVTPKTRDSMAEVARADVFVRCQVSNPLVLEAGITRAYGAFGIGTSEAADPWDGTGLYVSPQIGGRHFRIGTRLALGRMRSAEFGRGGGDGREPARTALYWSPVFLRLSVTF